MESTTYADERVVSYLDEHYLTAKVDIDDFDGFAWKEYYGVGALPTVLLFDSKGQVLEKRENALSPSQLLEILSLNVNRQAESASPSPDGWQTDQIASVAEPAQEAPGEMTLPAPYLQFGVYRSADNARKDYARLTKILTFPIEMTTREGSDGASYVLRSTGIPDADTLADWSSQCEAAAVPFLVKAAATWAKT